MKKISAYLSSIISWGVPWFGKEKKLFLGWIVLWGPYVWQWMKHMVGIYSLLWGGRRRFEGVEIIYGSIFFFLISFIYLYI